MRSALFARILMAACRSAKVARSVLRLQSPSRPHAPRMTQESGRPRASDRTRVGDIETRLAYYFQRTEWHRHESEPETTGGKKLRDLVTPRRREQLCDRPKPTDRETVQKRNGATRSEGLDVGKYFWGSGGEKCFSFDIPLYRTSGPSGSARLNSEWPVARSQSQTHR